MERRSKILTAEDIPLVAAASMERLGQHSVGFVRIIGNEDDAIIAGSGTLVTVGPQRAILTADHVLDELPSSGNIWLVRCREGWTQPHRFSIDASAVRKITAGKASHTADGPDLGLLVLAPSDVARLEATQTFYNLDKRRAQALDGAKLTPYGWALFGMIHEKTIESPPQNRFTRVKGFNGSVLFGVEPTERRGTDFDYLDFVALYNEHYTGPESYQGASGGGLWQLDYGQAPDGTVSVTSAVLSGVAYFESPRAGNTRTIYCHGRRSIYDTAYAALSSCDPKQ
jgi:hypothetical protein